jgi:ribulose bisphosphate carboxylase small subunit
MDLAKIAQNYEDFEKANLEATKEVKDGDDQGFKFGDVITEDEERAMANIEDAVQILVGKGWRIAVNEVSERRFMKSGEVLHSLKLEVRKGPLMADGC